MNQKLLNAAKSFGASINSARALLEPYAKLFEVLSKFALLVSIVTWLIEIPDRKIQRDNAAWALLNSAQGKAGNGGRTSALQALNRDGVSLSGVDLSGAYLRGVNLKRVHLAHADFRNADLSSAVFGCSAFEALASHLLFRTLTECTDLEKTNFLGSVLDFADFRRAFFDNSLFGSEAGMITYHNVAFTASTFAHTTFKNIEFFEPDFAKATMYRTKFENVRFVPTLISKTARPQLSRTPRSSNRIGTQSAATKLV